MPLKDPEARRAYDRERYQRRREAQCEYQKIYRGLTLSRQKEYKLFRKYGISIEQYEEILERQNGLCAICGGEEMYLLDGKPRALAVDRCHETGKVRSLLCTNCNAGVGYFNDDPARMRAAADYIEGHAHSQ